MPIRIEASNGGNPILHYGTAHCPVQKLSESREIVLEAQKSMRWMRENLEMNRGIQQMKVVISSFSQQMKTILPVIPSISAREHSDDQVPKW